MPERLAGNVAIVTGADRGIVVTSKPGQYGYYYSLAYQANICHSSIIHTLCNEGRDAIFS